MTEPDLKAAVLAFILADADPEREAATRREFEQRIWPQIVSAKWYVAQPMPNLAVGQHFRLAC